MVGSTGSLPGTLLLDATRLGQGTMGLTLQQATPGAAYELLGSSNLVDWIGLGTNSADSNGVLQFSDTNAAGLASRYYRAQAR